jgi:hypothetical protein
MIQIKAQPGALPHFFFGTAIAAIRTSTVSSGLYFRRTAWLSLRCADGRISAVWRHGAKLIRRFAWADSISMFRSSVHIRLAVDAGQSNGSETA